MMAAPPEGLLQQHFDLRFATHVSLPASIVRKLHAEERDASPASRPCPAIN